MERTEFIYKEKKNLRNRKSRFRLQHDWKITLKSLLCFGTTMPRGYTIISFVGDETLINFGNLVRCTLENIHGFLLVLLKILLF